MKNQLGVKFRVTSEGGQVRVTFGNKGVDIYNVEETKTGVEFHAISPWSGQPVLAASYDPKSAWKEVKVDIQEEVWEAFGDATIDAKRVGKILGIFSR